MTYAVVRLRGTLRIKPDIRQTLKLLMLTRANHCVLVAETPQMKGMLQKAKDYVTWGELDAETAALLVEKRAEYPGGARITDKDLTAAKKCAGTKALAKEISEGRATLRDAGAKPVIRLHPPIGGHDGKIKRPFNDGGALGYRGKEINKLLAKMTGGE